MKCSKCQSQNINENPKPCKGDDHRVELRCAECLNFVGWKPQKKTSIEAGLFKMPFGKYKGLTLSEISLQDQGYMDWLIKIAEGNVKRRLDEFYS